MDNNIARQRFETILGSVQRKGIPKLLAYLAGSDFYSASASSKGKGEDIYAHNAIEGGLVLHSLSVYDTMNQLLASGWPNPENPVRIPPESVAITALLHDLCKVRYYTPAVYNVKHYEEEIVQRELAAGNVVKKDAMGSYVWVSEQGFTIDDHCPFGGHGEKSVMLASLFVSLTTSEKMMIRWHKGYKNPKEYWPAMTKAFRKYPECLLLHFADTTANLVLDESDM